jgi:hypothetical protein
VMLRYFIHGLLWAFVDLNEQENVKKIGQSAAAGTSISRLCILWLPRPVDQSNHIKELGSSGMLQSSYAPVFHFVLLMQDTC